MATMVGTPWIRIKLMPELNLPIFRRPALHLCRSIRRNLCRSFSIAASVDSPGPRKNDGEVRVRFAPSPTGNLHVGGARTALFNYLFARSNGGKFVLRIEDTDLERSTKASEEAMLRDLTWLGLDWDEGPDVGGNYGPYRQSERNDLYKQYADKLLESGYVYRRFCSNEVSWSLDTLGDFVIMRSNGQPVYNFCVTVDDATMAISHVIRAEEHLPNTLRPALIYKALGFPMPYFAHVSLILAPDRSKLSKRHSATSVGQFREMGYLPQAMVNYLGLLGWSDGTENEFFTVDQLAEKFSIERVSKSGAIFDSVKLRWMNGHYVRSLPSDELTKAIGEHWKSAGILNESQVDFVEKAVALLKDGIDLVPDSDKALLNLLSYPLRDTLASPEAKPLLEDGLSEVAASLLAACDTGELIAVLEEGHAGWQKWVMAVSLFNISYFTFAVLYLGAYQALAHDFSIIGYPPDDLSSHERLHDLFVSWMSKHQKFYDDVEERLLRFEVFKDNLKHIDERNQQVTSFRLGLNEFADLTNEEFRNKYLGLRVAHQRMAGSSEDTETDHTHHLLKQNKTSSSAERRQA